MTPRVLVLVPEGHEATIPAGLSGVVAVARATGAITRIAYLRPLPAPRVDGHDRVVSDTDAEMARIAGAMTGALESAARTFTDLRIEVVVRFGAPRCEAAIEADAYGPDTVIVLASPAAPMRKRLGVWRLRRTLGRRPGPRLLVIEPAVRERPRRPMSGLIAEGLGTLDLRLP